MKFGHKKQNSVGFTIVELLIATMVFSSILLILTKGIIQIGKTYYKGVTSSKVQENTRAVIEEISQAIQYEGGSVIASILPPVGVTDSNLGGFCIGPRRYTYYKNRKVVDTSGSTTNALVSDSTGCNGSTRAINIVPTNISPASYSGFKELINVNTRIARISVTITDPLNPSLYTITVRLVAGDDDLLEDALDADGILDSCKQTLTAGSQFCAVSELTTTVQKRVQ